jgi:hypothetical protein
MMLKPISITIAFLLISVPLLALLQMLFGLNPTELKMLGLFNGLLIYGFFTAPAMDAVIRARIEEQKKKDDKNEK